MPFEAAKSALPAYVADSVFAPPLVEVRLQEPVPPESVAVQFTDPSDTLTVPVGVPAPGAFVTTETPTAYAWPTLLGSGVSLVIVVVVDAAFTWWPVEPAEAP